MNPLNKIKSIKINLLSSWWQDTLIKASINSDLPLNKPTSIIFDLTPNCVLRCRQCDIWRNQPEKHLSYEEAKKIIDKLHSWLGNFYLFFTGGEPLMNKDLPKIIGYAHSKGIISHINSNASLINKTVAKELTDNHLYAISISFDGARAKTHDYLRGVPGTFDKAINAIKYLQESSHLPKIYVNTVIMKNNLNELEKLIKLAENNKTNGITFQCLLPNLGAHSTQTALLNNPLWPEKIKVAKILKKIIKEKGAHPILLSSDQDLKATIEYYKNPNTINNKVCAAGINNFIINHHGDVFLCFQFPKIGNIIEDKPRKIWWNKNAQLQRQHIRKCQKNCKIIACNKADTRRNKTAASNFS